MLSNRILTLETGTGTQQSAGVVGVGGSGPVSSSSSNNDDDDHSSVKCDPGRCHLLLQLGIYIYIYF